MSALLDAVYGDAPRDLVEVPMGAVQCAPRVPGAILLTGMADASCRSVTVHAPASTIERRAVIAHALRVLAHGGKLMVFAANTKGGQRIADELTAFGCLTQASHKNRHQNLHTVRPEHPTGIDDAIAAGAPRVLDDLGLWSQPGLFNWDRIDPGSQLLLNHLPVLTGRGADLGCGFGVLARAIRAKSPDAAITLIDIDARAVDLARRNVSGDGVTTLWADVRSARDLPAMLDFVVTNPPFHDGSEEDKALGQAFIQKAAAMLRPGGVLWLTANRHLPYEATLKPLFETVEQIAQANGFKVYAARKAATSAVTAPSRTHKVRR